MGYIVPPPSKLMKRRPDRFQIKDLQDFRRLLDFSTFLPCYFPFGAIRNFFFLFYFNFCTTKSSDATGCRASARTMVDCDEVYRVAKKKRESLEVG